VLMQGKGAAGSLQTKEPEKWEKCRCYNDV